MKSAFVCIVCIVLCGCAEDAAGPAASSESPYNLGVQAYRAKDYAKAFQHWSEAAAHGELNALNNLGYLLYNGYGVKKSYEEAIKLWRIASFAGHAESQWHLAWAYESGEGIEQDRLKAYAWYVCAVDSAARELKQSSESDAESVVIKGARSSIDELKSMLDANELKDAEALAAEYVARYAKAAP